MLRLLVPMALAILAVGCGRFGIEFITSAPGLDAGEPSVASDAAMNAADGGGTYPPPTPVVDDAGSAVDAGPSYAMDAGVDASQPGDAATDAAAGEAGQSDAAPTDASATGVDASQSTDAAMNAESGTPPTCGGQLVFGLCWYLADPSTSCNRFCSSHGGFDPASIGHVGTPNQGGSRDDCAQILAQLGHRNNVVEAMRSDGNGLGCHVWTDGTNYWLVDPPFSPTSAAPNGTNVRIACGCLQ